MAERIIQRGHVSIERYIPYARKLMGLQKRYMEVGGLPSLTNSIVLHDGTWIRLSSAAGIDNIIIHAPTVGVVEIEKVAPEEYQHGVWIWVGGSAGLVAAVHYENFATLLGQYIYTEVSQAPEIPPGVGYSQAVFIIGLARSLSGGELSILQQLLANQGKIFFWFTDNGRLSHQRIYIDRALDQLNSPMTIDYIHRNAVENFEQHDMPFGPGEGNWIDSISRWLVWYTTTTMVPSRLGERITQFRLPVGDETVAPVGGRGPDFAIYPRCTPSVGRGPIDIERFPQIQTLVVDSDDRPVVCDTIVPLWYSEVLQWMRRCHVDSGVWPDPINIPQFTTEQAEAVQAWSYITDGFGGSDSTPYSAFLSCSFAFYGGIYVCTGDSKFAFSEWFEIPRYNQPQTIQLFWSYILNTPSYHSDWPFILGPTYYVADCDYADDQGWWIVPGPAFIPPIQE